MKHELDTGLELAVKAALEIRSYYYRGAQNWQKDNDTPVTEADLAANQIILEGLNRKFPNDTIVSEETGTHGNLGSRVWYIDPLDGTKSFVNKGDTFAVHIGLAIDGQPALGIVYKPIALECYAGIVGQGAWKKNDLSDWVPMQVSTHRQKPVVITGSKVEENDLIRPVVEAYKLQEVLHSGSVGIRVGRIAEGIADLYVGSKRSNSWDVCAPMAILQAAGGSYSYLFGKAIRFEGQGAMEDRVIFASTKMHEENARRLIQDKMADVLAHYQVGS